MSSAAENGSRHDSRGIGSYGAVCFGATFGYVLAGLLANAHKQ